ncbi:zinc metalloproteinase nas-13-like [Clytia hemisphaerica]|uniref:Metalloendopeptidase n=1 Tax=Clytia hemisphaerica TaxID=252671 RepID=A0A7M5ULQ9_9CNID
MKLIFLAVSLIVVTLDALPKHGVFRPPTEIEVNENFYHRHGDIERIQHNDVSNFKRLAKKLKHIIGETKVLKRVLDTRKKFGHLKSVADVNYHRYGRKNDIIESENRKRNSVKINLWNPTQPGERLVIPYSFRSDYPNRLRPYVEKAIKSMNQHLRCGYDVWVPYSNQAHRVEFIKDGGCYSLLGKDTSEGNKQPISIDDGCEAKHIVLHEMMHAMGFYHEQNRFDRDQFIKINWNNIQDGMASQFDKASNNNIFQTSVPYDYMSVMQYSLSSFSKNGQNTMTILKNAQSAKLTAQDLRILGDVPDLSAEDLQEVRAYFNCNSAGGRTTARPAPRTTARPAPRTTRRPATNRPRTTRGTTETGGEATWSWVSDGSTESYGTDATESYGTESYGTEATEIYGTEATDIYGSEGTEFY